MGKKSPVYLVGRRGRNAVLFGTKIKNKPKETKILVENKKEKEIK